MASGITEIFSDSRTGKRGIILKGGRICGSSSHYDCIVHGTFGTKSLNNRGHSGTFLAHGYIYTIDRLPFQEFASLIDNGIDGDCRLSCLTVSDNQFSLSASDRNHRIHSLQSRLQRFCNRLTENHSRRFTFKRHSYRITLDFAHTIQRRSNRVNNSSDKPFPHRNTSYSAESAHTHSLTDEICRSKKHCAHIVDFKVHRYGLDSAVKFEKLACFNVDETENTRHAITDRKHLTDLLILQRTVYSLELVKEYFRYFTWFYIILCHRTYYTILVLNFTNWRRMLSS
ncbi:uncharacterized protein BN459_00174 [Bacteroides sp. CAG:1060]|nr:uncharacterized protein BN459_00174 [Bacteroides sp. CAG:1060]